jgi:ferritin
MISKTIEDALNKQIAMEAYASYYYLSMAAWCGQQGLSGCEKFFFRQSGEERDHMLRIFNYVVEMDGHARAPGVEQPPAHFDSVQQVLEKAYGHEQKVTRAINEIVGLCYKENDYATLDFLQWYVQEQREEEMVARTILDKVRLIGSGPQSLYYIDMELEKINQAQLAAEASEGGAA